MSATLEPVSIAANRAGSDKKAVDWDQVRRWDEAYVFHVCSTAEEYHSNAVESTDGCYVTLAGGTRIFDFANQLVCVNMGHRHPRIQQAIREATEKFGYVWEGLTTEYRSRAAKLIMEDLGVGRWAGRIRFLATGTEAVENMVQFAKLYTGRRHIVTRSYDYHGWTNGLTGANGVRGYRSSLASGGGEPAIRDIPDSPSPNYHYAPSPQCYRCPIGHTYPNCKDKSGTLACVRATEHLIRTIGVESVAGFLTEPAQGAGMIHPPVEYFPQIREMTARLGVLWLDDEVMTGFGRLGEWFGYDVYRRDARHHGGGQGPRILRASRLRRHPLQGVERLLRQMAFRDHEHVRLAPARDGRRLREHRSHARGKHPREGARARRAPGRGIA